MDTLDSTLEELEGDGWGEPPYPSHLVAAVAARAIAAAGTSGQEHGPIVAKAIRKAYGAFIS